MATTVPLFEAPIVAPGRGGARRRQQPEVQIQRAVIECLAWCARPGVFAFHVPNGGFRKPIEAAILKSIGTVAGIPDIVCVFKGRVYALELKSEGGRVTDVQCVVHARLREAGAEVAVAYGLDAALAQLQSWQLLRGLATIHSDNSRPAAGQGNARRELRARRRAKGIKNNERFSIQRRYGQ
jgi:hypothetical protein